MRRIGLAAAIIGTALVGSLLPALAGAALTPVNALGSGDGFERCLTGPSCPAIADYSGAPSLISIFENELGKGAFTRIDDALDKLWTASNDYAVLVRPRARYADDNGAGAFDFAFGASRSGSVRLSDENDNYSLWVNKPSLYSGDPQSGDFERLARNGGWTVLPVAAGASPLTLFDVDNGRRLQSDRGEPDAARRFDPMVTFKVNDTVPHYFIAFEDDRSRRSDRDYNDLVIEVLFASPQGSVAPPIPEPSTMVLGALGLAGIAAYSRRARPRRNGGNDARALSAST